MHKNLLRLLAAALLCGACWACENGQDAPSFTCGGAAIRLTMADKTSQLAVVNNTLFRAATDSGGYKLLTLESANDSFKIIFNLRAGPYRGNSLWDDRLPVQRYSYSRQATGPNSGLVAAGIKAGNSFQFADTDTSAVTLTRWDLTEQTMSGTYYFETVGRTVRGEGSFNNVCFVSLK